MSQAGIIEFESAHPNVPTSFVTNVGTAVPIANVLEILGTTVANHHIPVETTGTANIVTVVAQYAAATVATTTTDAGFASFNSAEFTVDANGWVSIAGGAAIAKVAVDAHTAPGTNPVVPDGTGQITVTGGQVAAGTTANVIQTNSLAANTYTIQIQRSQAVAVSTAGDNGVSHFNSADFTVDGNGFVSTIHNGTITSVQTANATPQFVLAGTVETVDFNLSNLVLGSSLPSLTSGVRNVGFGSNCLNSLTSSTDNTAVGYEALSSTTGLNNIGIGSLAGSSYTGTESSNILIGNIGILSESHVIRVGTAGSGTGQQSSCYIAGISGVTVAASSPILVNASGQLSDVGFGTATYVLTSNGAGVSPTWQPILPSSFPWLDASGVFTAAINTGYFLTGASTTTLPASPAQGDIIEFFVDANALCTITANTGQVIQYDGATSAAAGTLAASTLGNSVRLVYRSSNTSWNAIASMGASWTVT